MTALKKKSATDVITENVTMSELKCTECCFLGFYQDKYEKRRVYICKNRKTFNKTLTFGSFDFPYKPIVEEAPKWCALRKSEYNIIGTLYDVCHTLSTQNTFVEFSIEDCPDITYSGELLKFINRNAHYMAFRFCDVIELKIKETFVNLKPVNQVRIKITTKCEY